MATDEEYLDNLLKSVSEEEQPPRQMQEALKEIAEVARKMESYNDEKEEAEMNHPGEWNMDNVDMDKLLEQADLLVNEEFMKKDSESDPEAEPGDSLLQDESVEDDSFMNEAFETGNFFDENIANEDNIPEMVMLDSEGEPESPDSTGSDPDLDEINSLLNNAGRIESVDDDMLALLESSGENQDMFDNGEEAFDIFEEEMSEESRGVEALPAEDKAEEEEEPKKKKGAKKKKKKKEGKESSENKKSAKKKEKEEKGPGFLAGLLAKFAQKKEETSGEEIDTAAEENIKILEELNKEEKKGAGKGKTQGNKKEKKKSAKPAKKTSKPAKKKASPPKAKKKEKAPDAVPEKPAKPLSKASIATLAALCVTLIAGIYIVGTFLPEYVDKQSARKAFIDRDYATVYRLFYDKELGGSEEEIYNKSRILLKLDRRLKSYENNMTLGRESEAVDALLMGVVCYQDSVTEADLYGIRGELDAIYQQICSILESNYGVSEERAAEISGYDEIDYTKAVNAMVNGTENEAVEDISDGGTEVSDEPQDVLQEEEDLIDDEN